MDNDYLAVSSDGHLSFQIDDAAVRSRAKEIARETGDGLIRNERGHVVAQHALSIDIGELNALLAIGDPDATEYKASGYKDLKALRRLVLRYPHWLVSDGAVLKRFFK